jgi:23S rRNA (guanosine2251-2'-O)-methyltransferase
VKKAQKNRSAGRERRLRFSEDLLWGIHPIFEALTEKPKSLNEIILVKERKGGKWEDIIALARKAGVRLSFVESLKLTGEGSGEIRHQGIVARLNQTEILSLEDILSKFKQAVERGEKPRLIVCDSLQDPHNLGAIIRSAHASGATGVILTRERSAPMGGTAAKSSAGAVAHIDICQVTNLATALQKLKDAGAWVFGAIKDAEAQSLYETDLNVAACIVVGSEGQGIRPLVRKQCDILISIPMVGTLDSLNSSVAAGVILFEALRQSNL